jgi:hypothetical protein
MTREICKVKLYIGLEMIYWYKRYHQRHDVCVGMLLKSPKDSQFDSQFDTYIWHSKNAVNLILIYIWHFKKKNCPVHCLLINQ